MFYNIYIALFKWILITPFLFIVKNILLLLRNYNIIHYNLCDNIIIFIYLISYIYIFNHYKIIYFFLHINPVNIINKLFYPLMYIKNYLNK